MKILVPDRFDVIRLLNDDGGSQTFIANDTLLRRADVVVKVIRKSQSDAWLGLSGSKDVLVHRRPAHQFSHDFGRLNHVKGRSVLRAGLPTHL